MKDCKYKILIVEDEALIAKGMQVQLTLLGFDVIPDLPISAEEACAKAAAWQADLVLMDIERVGALNGSAAAQMVRAANGTPVVFFSSFSDNDKIERAKEGGGYGFLVKTVSDRELKTVVDIAICRGKQEILLNQQFKQQAAIADFSQLALTNQSLQDLSIHCVGMVANILRADYCMVLEKSQEGNTLHLVAGEGFSIAQIGEEVALGFGDHGTLFTALAKQGASTLADSCQRGDVLPAAFFTKLAIRDGVFLKIEDSQGIYGVLAVFTKQVREFAPSEVDFIRSLSHILSQAVHRQVYIAALDDSVTRFHQMANHMRQVMWIADAQSQKILYINPICQSLWGPQANTRLKDLAALHTRVHPDDYEHVKKVMGRVRQGVDADERYRMVKDGGSLCWVWDRRVAIKNDQGVVERIVGIIDDITDQKTLEELLKAVEVLSTTLDYQHTLNNIAQTVVPQFADWCAIDIVNDQLELKREAIAHKEPGKQELVDSLQTKYSNEPLFADLLRQVIETGEPKLLSEVDPALALGLVGRGQRLDDLRAIGIKSLMIVPILARKRVVGAITFIFADCGKRYSRADVALAQQLALYAAFALENAKSYRDIEVVNRMKDDFLSIVSHELRTPMSVIFTWTEMLRKDQVEQGEYKEVFEIIFRNAKSQVNLINDLLDTSKIIAGKMEFKRQEVKLSRVVEETVRSLRFYAEARHVGIRVTVNYKAGVIWGDPNRLQQMVYNLLANAIKFSDKGGQVDVLIERSHSSVEIIIRDEGVGIDPDFLPYIFERFLQEDSSRSRKYGGLGIGLSLVRHIAEQHGGQVRVDSKGKGKGAQFIVRLPIPAIIRNQLRIGGEDGRAGALASVTPIQAKLLTGLTVLVVDDEPDARALISRTLTLSGAVVIEAASASEALMAMNHARPNVMISDIGMPGHDGYDLIREVRGREGKSDKPLPAAALTAYSQAQDKIKILASGYQLHLSKPIENSSLVAAVAQLGGRSPQSARRRQIPNNS